MTELEEERELAPGEPTMEEAAKVLSRLVPDIDMDVSGTGNMPKSTMLEYAQAFINETGDLSVLLPLTAMIKGSPYSLLNFPMFKPLFNAYNNPMETVYQCCRQVGKTESLSALMCLRGMIRENYHSLVVAPRHEQAVRISSYKTIPFLKESLDAYVPNFYVDDMRSVGKTAIKLKNDNTIDFIGCYLSPDASRGFAKDVVYWDEYQDINPEHTPVVNECTSGSLLYGEALYFGTPKSTFGPLTEKFMEGSQGYWCVPCSHCGEETWANDDIDDDGKYACERIITQDGPQCLHCGEIYTVDEVLYNGYYKHRFPERLKDRILEDGSTRQAIASFHVCQALHPAHMISKAKWADLYRKANGGMERVTFLNECCGIAADRGNVLITPAELAAACSDNEAHVNNMLTSRKRRLPIKGKKAYLCVDWSGFGGDSSDSFTALALIQHPVNDPGKVTCTYMERMPKDTSPEQTAAHIINLFHALKPDAIVHDQGGAGFLAEVILRQKLPPNKIIGITYVGAGGNMRTRTVQPAKATTHRSGLTLAKSRSLELFYLLVKARKITFPYKDENTWDCLADLLHIQRESRVINGEGVDRHYMIKLPGKPDDMAHALNMGISFILMKSGTYPDVYEALLGTSHLS
jgi:hypothetical protein